ncbi:MAG: hypothetical protein WCS37_17980 [Chloroflexota bacterium]|nr:hypothetical protein [Chloroflexota bacterium]
MGNFARDDSLSSPSRSPNSSVESPGLLFSTIPLIEMVNGLNRYYAMLKTFLVTPGVIRYEDLVQLRRRAAQVDFGTAPFGRFQAQLRLAIELIRLGRRSEGFKLLSQVEERLPILSEAQETQSTAIVYGLWLALVKASSGNLPAAFETMQRLIVLIPDQAIGAKLVTFFQGINNVPLREVSLTL